MRCAVLLLVVACGRFGFEERVGGDAAIDVRDAMPCVSLIAHDEDLDGVHDDCDVCPHIAGVQSDQDGDRVGDACDPEPTNARQSIVVFDPFTDLAAWGTRGSVIPGTDSVKVGVVGNFGALDRAFVPALDTFAIGVKTGAKGNGLSLVGILFREASPPEVVYCEHYDASDAPTGSLFITYTLDGASYMHPDGATAPLLASGSGMLSASIDATTLSCGLVWGATTVSVMGTRPPEVVPVLFTLYTENVDAQLDYFIQIRTAP